MCSAENKSHAGTIEVVHTLTPRIVVGSDMIIAHMDRRKSMMAALEPWVEQGVIPERVVAAHRSDGTVDRTRPLCAYPQVARYVGTGSIDAAANFVCRTP